MAFIIPDTNFSDEPNIATLKASGAGFGRGG
jgi:hypothetical protein